MSNKNIKLHNSLSPERRQGPLGRLNNKKNFNKNKINNTHLISTILAIVILKKVFKM